jgi:PAS domain S-box-containing protein/putative nucleotidyltransferase with HDIG domain
MLVNAKSFRYVDANQAALTLFGVSSLKDLTTLGPMGLSPERQPDGMLTIDKVKIETEKTLREGSDFFEWEHQRVDGQRFLADILLTRVDFLGEQFVLANVRDVSERKRLQQELERSEFNYRMLFEFAPAGMIAASPESGKILQANSKALSMFGYELDEIITKTLTDITYQEDLAVSDERNKRLAEGALHNLAFKKRYLRKDGSHFWAESFASALKDSNGKVIRFVGSIVDITERKLAEEKISSYLQQLERSMEGTLHAVSNMIEFRDPYTAGHERRVGIIAADIAREMGWPNERCKNLEYIGLVHDIGKIAIPAEILTKPSRLSCLEYEMVKGHAEKGYEVLKDVDFPLPIAEIIRQHHERMDGSGYPRGLRGEEILMEARIIAVADVLESIASHRPYRPALGVEVAIKEIEENKGTLFDEQVVVALLNLFRVKKYQLPV